MTKLVKRLKSKKGFTLVELIVVIAILAILAAILVPTMLGVLGDSKQSVANANAKSVFTAAQSSFVLATANKGEWITTDADTPYITYNATDVKGASGTLEEADSAVNYFLISLKGNLGNDFKGDYIIKLNADGAVGVIYSDDKGATVGEYGDVEGLEFE